MVGPEAGLEQLDDIQANRDKEITLGNQAMVRL